MCNCGRNREVVTSVQAQADVDARRASDAEQNAAAMVASIANAVANASGNTNAGWYLAPE